MLTVTSSKGRLRYMRQVFIRSGNSAVHGAHHVAQKLTSSVLPVGFLRSVRMPSTSIFSSGTGSFAKACASASREAFLSSHFTEQPTAGVLSRCLGFLARRASLGLSDSATLG